MSIIPSDEEIKRLVCLYSAETVCLIPPMKYTIYCQSVKLQYSRYCEIAKQYHMSLDVMLKQIIDHYDSFPFSIPESDFVTILK